MSRPKLEGPDRRIGKTSQPSKPNGPKTIIRQYTKSTKISTE